MGHAPRGEPRGQVAERSVTEPRTRLIQATNRHQPSRRRVLFACSPHRDAALPPCTGPAGVLRYPIFFIDVNGFRVGPGYVGVDGKPVGHLTISATKHEDSPGPPCGTVVGTFRISDRTVTEYSCTNDSLRVQRNARHGEGAYVGHVLLAWSANGIDDAVSAHGHTQANLALVKRLASSITFTAPTESREEAASASLRSVVGSGLLSAIDLVVKARGAEYQRLTGSRSSSARPGESR